MLNAGKVALKSLTGIKRTSVDTLDCARELGEREQQIGSIARLNMLCQVYRCCLETTDCDSVATSPVVLR